ncbi:hypothetical protein EON65_03285 [archaeon]|nr:MAG: hypothetical protein EON65_03285 [archaeon]
MDTSNSTTATAPQMATSHQPNTDSHAEQPGSTHSNRGNRSRPRHPNRKPKASSKPSMNDTRSTQSQVIASKAVTAAASTSRRPLDSNPTNTRKSFSCPICLQESTNSRDASRAFNGANFMAVGPCDHPICSLCALRMRCKSKSYECSLCKANLPLMVVISVHSNLVNNTFSELLQCIPCHWAIDLSTVDLMDINHPSVSVDLDNKLIYYQCAGVYQYNENLKSLHCPVRSCTYNQQAESAEQDANTAMLARQGITRFRSMKHLLQHLQRDHQNMSMCTLCLEHRPLFISEHEVFFNAHKYKQHLHGNVTGGMQSKNNLYNLGHPECRLCKENFFDLSALYKHMNVKHYTCTLCEQSYMFRYYKDIAALREHHHQAHYVCNICHNDSSIRNSDIMYAFKLYTEFMYHMKGYHNITDVQRYLVNNNTRKAVSKTAEATLSYQDLNMGTASPLPNPPPVSLPSTTYSDSILSQIPANMTVAGRVTGTGRFSAMHSDEANALQMMIQDNQRTAVLNGAVQQEDEGQFPSLGPNTTTAKPTSRVPQAAAARSAISAVTDPPPPAASTIHEVHPMSVLNRKPVSKPSSDTADSPVPPAATSKAGIKSRAQMLADALGVNTDSSVHHPDSHISYKISQFISKRPRVSLSPKTLATPLYPEAVLNWARNNKGELLRIENKIVAFMQSSEHSLHFKPMPIAYRQLLHVYAKYIDCNSYEYDIEPKRYVSFVKKNGSLMPVVPLSVASNMPVCSVGSDATGCQLFFVLREGVQANWHSPTDVTKHKAVLPFSLAHVTVVDVAEHVLEAVQVIQADYEEVFTHQKSNSNMHFSNPLYYTLYNTIHKEILDNNINLSFKVLSVAHKGANGITLELDSKYACSIVGLYLNFPSFWESAGEIHVVDMMRYYNVMVNFSLPDFIQPVQEAWGEGYMDDGWDEGERVVRDDAHGVAAGEGEGNDDGEFRASDYVIVDNPRAHTKAFVADWEDIVDLEGEGGVSPDRPGVHKRQDGRGHASQSEWDRFLAEKRESSAGAGVYVPKRYETKSVVAKVEPNESTVTTTEQSDVVASVNATKSNARKSGQHGGKTKKEDSAFAKMANRFGALLGAEDDDDDSEDDA